MLKYLYIKLLNKTLLVLCVLSTFEVSFFLSYFLKYFQGFLFFFKSNQIDMTLEELAETSFKMLKIDKIEKKNKRDKENAFRDLLRPH